MPRKKNAVQPLARAATPLPSLKHQHGEREIASLRTLQRLSQEITASLNFEDVCQSIYRGTHELMACDAFFIALFDEFSNMLDFSIRIEQGIILPTLKTPLDDGVASTVLRTRELVYSPDVERESRFKIHHWWMGPPAQSLICVPMLLRNKIIGALSAQSYQPRSYDEIDMQILMNFAAQAAIAIQNAQLFAQTQRKVKQLAVLNEVGRIVSSTIEIDQLLDLIYDQVRRILKADTYYVTLYDAVRRIHKVEVLVDEGRRFPSEEIPLGEGLSSLVIQRREPLLVRSITKEASRLKVTMRMMGSPRSSESWLGIPLMTSGHLLGVLAVASYEPNVFDEGDQEVLQNIAIQAAITIDNARHHAEVEDQARRDSLTQVLNHGFFVQSLQNEIKSTREKDGSIALIMLDVDHFKEYNDRYGHLAGDAILRGTVQAIHENVKQSDLIGRWGGEEFAIALLESNLEGALGVAERIRRLLPEMRLKDDQGRSVPAPTVSQGIAMFPEDAVEAFTLVDVADRRLYKAKERGRDQVQGD